MDQKLAKYFILLREEAEAGRRGASTEVSDVITDISRLTSDLVEERDIAFAVAAVFDEESGVLSSVEVMLPSRDRAIQKARESCLTFLAQFISRIGRRALPYASLVKDRCLSIFRREDSRSVQAAALVPLLSVLELSMQEGKALDFSLDWTCVESLLVDYRKAKTSGTLRSNILVFIGYAVERFPHSFQEENLNTILKLCLDTLEEQLHQTGKDPLYILVSGAIKCLDSLLTWFDETLPAGGSVGNSRKIYTYIEQVLHFREDLRRYEMVKAGLRLLSRHARLFRLRLVENSVVILKWLQAYCIHTNTQLREAALPTLYQFISEIVSCIASDDHRIKNPQQIYKKIFSEALGILDSKGNDPRLTSLAILTMGKLSPLIVKFSGKESLVQTFYRLVPFGSNSHRANGGREESLKFSVTLVAAFADIVVYLDSIENYIVSLIAEAVGNIFYGYPYLFPKKRQEVYASLQSLFKALYSQEAVFSVFLNNIVWSSLERAMEPVDDKDSGAPLWKHYVELWSKLLIFFSNKRVEHKNNDVELENIRDPEPVAAFFENRNDTELQSCVFDCLLRCIMKAMAELNVKYTVKSIPVQASGNSSGEPDLEADPSGCEGALDLIEPLDLLQMKKYLNLVEFVQSLLASEFTNLFLKWVYPFGRCLVELSSRYPLISGFYKLLAICIHRADERGYFGKMESSLSMKTIGSTKEAGNPLEGDIRFGDIISQQDQDLCKDLFRKYLQEVLISSRRYKLELLVSCLHLCLSAPPPIIDIESLVGPMISALKIGLRHFPLAMVAMDSIETWHRLHPNKLKPWLQQIVPYFNNYLVQFERKGLGEETISNAYGPNGSSRIGRSKKLAQGKEIHAEEVQMGSFEHVQIRIQKFLGIIGGQSHLLVPDVDLLQVFGVGGLAWDTVNQVKFTLPFRDTKPDIWLDSLLLRIVEISSSSNDRQVKIASSELLHAICLVMVGNAAKGPTRRKGQEQQGVHYGKIYRRLFPAILRLATDVELVTRQLFTAFVKQLIHWFTSNTQKENPDSMALLDSILDGVVDAENGSLREFSAECFAEFMQWSVRHAPAEGDNFVNIASMLRRLYTRLDHPNPYHRLGATMAAYLMYPVLKENGSIVDHHILEILFFCIKSLRIGEHDDNQIGTMKQMSRLLERMQRLVQRNITTLQKNLKDRKMFSNMQDFLDWLFLQTGRQEENCRRKCMWLFSSICEAMPVGSCANWFKSKFKNVEQVRNTLSVFDIGLRFPEHNGDTHAIQSLEIWMGKFVCSIHWYEWALKEQFLSLNDMFIMTELENFSIAYAIDAFLQNSCCEPTCLDSVTPLTPLQKEYHGSLQVKTIFQLLNFLKVILYTELGIKEQDIQGTQELTHLQLKEDSRVHKLVPFSEPHFVNLISQIIFHPRKITFSSPECQSIEELMRLTVKIVKMLSSASSIFKQRFIQALRSFVSGNIIELDLNTYNHSGGTDLVDMMYLLKGYQQLHLAGALLPALGKENAKATGQKLLQSLFSLGRAISPAVQPIALEILTLAIALGVTASQLLELVLDHRALNESETDRAAVIAAGSNFYFNFRKVIVQQTKFLYKDCLSLLLQEAVKNFTARLLLNAVLDDYLKVESITKSSFLREVVKHIQLLKPCCNIEATLSDKLFFLVILQKLFMLDTSCDTVLAENQPSFGFIIESYFLLLNSNHQVPVSGASKLLQTSTVMTVKSNTLIMVPYFFKSSIDNNVLNRLIDSLTCVVTDHLLVREADIPHGSNERVAYIQMLQRLEDAVLAGNKVELLEIVFPLFKSDVKLARKKVHGILQSYAEIVGENRGIACASCLKLLNDCGKIPGLRRAVFDYMFVPLIVRAPVDFLVGWYEEHITEFKEVLDRHPERVQSSSEIEQDYLVVRICHYKLVELLFNCLDASTIKDRITPLISNQQLMQYAISDSRAKNDPPVFCFPDNINLWHELHIAAYNCLAGVVMRTQDQERIYLFLFKDFPGKPLWQHIVDCSKVYNNFPVETSMVQTSYLAVKGMRTERTFTQRVGQTHSLSSQYVVGATLSDEPILINTFLNQSQKRTGDEATVDDDNGQIIADSSEGDDLSATQNNGKELVEKEAIDEDDFDRHPSMGIILQLIEHCQDQFGSKLSNGGMPEWMKALYSTLHNAVTPINVCLFIAKIITKARKVFAPFASDWFGPYLQVILKDPDCSGGRTFHYMLRDICITILEWNLPAPPDMSVASHFVNHLISVTAHDSRLVLRANLEIIRLYLQTWKDSITLDRRTVILYLTIGGKSPDTNDKSIGIKRSVGLQLLGAMAASNISLCGSPGDFTVSEDDICKALLLNVSYKMKNVYEAAAELLGIIFKYIEEGKLNINEQMLHVPLKQTLRSLFKDGDSGQFLNIVDKITLHFPLFLEGYASMVLDLLARTHGVFRITALNILLRRPGSVPNLYNMIAPVLSKLLTHRDEIAQFKSLQLVSELVKDISTSTITEKVLPVLCETFTIHENIDCRQLYFNILIFLYKEKGLDKCELLHHHLLLGLIDDSNAVRQNLQNFWHLELSQDLCPRFIEMINYIYDPEIEECWAQITNKLLLKLCEDSVDFGRPIFNAPLSDCEFSEHAINTSWLGGTLPMTPLFSGTQLSSLQSQDNAIKESQGKEIADTTKGQHMVRATYVPSQTLFLSQTQSTMSRDTEAGSSLLALSQNDERSGLGTLEYGGALVDTSTKLKRRILHSSIAKPQAKINALSALRRRQSRLAQQSLERENKVQMMRRYRTGELPDIEITHRDVIIPLSVLAEKDVVFSRLLLIVLCHAIYSLHSNELHKAEHELKLSVREGIERALQRTRNGASFVGCAMDVCLESKESWIQPKLVGSAAQKSRNFHTGILFLENAILHETPPDLLNEASRKRHCGSKRKVSQGGDVLSEAWLELVKLYKSIGEYDVVLSIYKNKLTKAEVTEHALEAQLRGDSSKALQLYDKAINTFEGENFEKGVNITQIEQDIWYNQRLQCLVDLNRWQDIMEDSLCQIKNEITEEPDFQKLWSPDIQDPYLCLFIKGSVKLTKYSSLLSNFVQDTLEDPKRRELLHDEFSIELASLAIINDQFDLANFYIQNCYKSFRKQWSSIHPLATVSKHILVRQLQRIIEIDEFVKFITTKDMSVQLQSLFEAWRNRWPSAEFDDVEAWDDIVQNRLMYFQKSQGLLRKLDEDFGRWLVANLDSERADIFYQASRGLMWQGAYDAAQGYMNQHMAAIEGSSRKEKLDFKFFKGLVKLRCLQADRESTLNVHEAIKMLQQVRDYVTSTAKKQIYQSQKHWRTGLQLLEGDVTSQLAKVSLKVLPLHCNSSETVQNCISLVSSAYTVYSGLLESASDVVQFGEDAQFPSKKLAKVFLKFAFFCDELLSSTKYAQWGSEVQSRIKQGNSSTGLPHSSTYPSLVVRYIMKAVQVDNSMQVQHGIARVLTLLGHYSETHSEFLCQLKGIPCWLFIAWIPQMLAVMDKDEGGILVGLLENIADSYPQALYFPFNVSKSDFGSVGQNRAKRLETLLNNPVIKGFTRALEDLTFPEQRLRNGLAHLKNCLSVGDNKGAQEAFHNLFQDCLDVRAMSNDNRKSGEYNLKFARDYSKRVLKSLGENGSKLNSMDEKSYSEAIKDVMVNLVKCQNNLQTGKISISSLSKWMADYDASQEFIRQGSFLSPSPVYSSIHDQEEYSKTSIEIPGISSSFMKPDPSVHVKLISFDQTLLCLSSKQRPKVLKMRGSDEKDYKFVVKGGEDLRLDQRIEQLFDVMNTILSKDSSCARRKLSLRTYAVIPISKQCGIMQFVEDTCVLEDVIKDGLAHRLPTSGQPISRQDKNTPIGLLSHLRIEYHEWIAKRGASRNVSSESYTNMYRKVGADEVSQKLNALSSQLPWDALKTGMSRLATSAESFLALRSQFVRSLSVLSICGYIAGVGDRHLSNFLMDTKNGMLVPIDFGYSFGTGVILLPVPELIPFRLTPQFTNLLLPLDSIALLRNDMICTLSALHSNREIISAVLDVFVNEPLVDWKNEAMKTASLQQSEPFEGNSESQPHQVTSLEQQHVALKVENAHRKLNLWNPADIIISELHSSIHSRKPHLPDLEKIARGNPEKNIRARICRSVCETIQEQVDCLIDQATDPNLLGRIWVGWQPWL